MVMWFCWEKAKIVCREFSKKVRERGGGGRKRETLTALIPSQSLAVWEEMLEAILSTKLLW